VRHKCDIQSLSYGPLVPSRGWDHQMEISSTITDAALPVGPGRRRRPRSTHSAACRLPWQESARVPWTLLEARRLAREGCAHCLNYPLWVAFLTDMVAATRRYRHAVPPVRGWLLVARLPPQLSGSELRYRRAHACSCRQTGRGRRYATVRTGNRLPDQCSPSVRRPARSAREDNFGHGLDLADTQRVGLVDHAVGPR
jgi:hypothetical protein